MLLFYLGEKKQMKAGMWRGRGAISTQTKHS